jgi:hypothetical protein
MERIGIWLALLLLVSLPLAADGPGYSSTGTGLAANSLLLEGHAASYFQIASFANVKSYGAYGDGSHDDTTVIQAALNAATNVYFPAGTYVVSNLVATKAQVLSGDGTESILRFKAGSTGVLFTTIYTGGIYRLAFDGGSATDKSAVVTPSADRSALSVRALSNIRIQDVSIYGFEKYGITSVTSGNKEYSNLILSGTTIYDCWAAVYLETTYTEYLLMSALDIHHNYYGLYLSPGNLNVNASKIIYNGIGVAVVSAGSNNSHASVSGCLINHNTTAIYTEGLTHGMEFNGNQIWEGIIHLKTSSGVKIENGEIDATAYQFEGGGRNYVRNNFISSDYTGTITHSYNGSADMTLMVDNWNAAGAYLDSGSTLTTEADTLATVTGRGAVTATPVLIDTGSNAATVVDGIGLRNDTAADGTTRLQYSPTSWWESHAYDADGYDDKWVWRAYNVPVTAPATGSQLYFTAQKNTDTSVGVMSINYGGAYSGGWVGINDPTPTKYSAGWFALNVKSFDGYGCLRLQAGQPLIKWAGNYNGGNGAELYQNTAGAFNLNVNSDVTGFTVNANQTVTFYGAISGAPSISCSPTISTGTAAPTSTPAKVGDMYVDTTNHKLYFADGIASSSNWVIAN